MFDKKSIVLLTGFESLLVRISCADYTTIIKENMRYKQGSFGRVFVLKFEDGDDLLEEIKKFAVRERVKISTIMLLGGMRSAHIVVGPKKAVIPPEPMWTEFSDGREILGCGTLFWKDNEPSIHLHGAIGRGKETIVGCVRKDNMVYLVAEAVIAEIINMDARRVMDEQAGLALLEL